MKLSAPPQTQHSEFGKSHVHIPHLEPPKHTLLRLANSNNPPT